MATVAAPEQSALQKERNFFFYMAIVMALVIVAGFATRLATGGSSFGLPLIYHVHAFTFFGWVALYLVQNALVASGSTALHRRLGVLALVWVPAMIVMGLAMTVYSIRGKGGPPFFDQNEFLFGNSIALLSFAGLVLAALYKRGQPDWHRRFMYCGMAILIVPGLDRLLPDPMLIPWAWWAGIAGASIFLAVGMVADKARSGMVHRAWLWGIAIFVGGQLVADAIAYSPVGISITQAVMAGQPGAARGMKAHMPGT